MKLRTPTEPLGGPCQDRLRAIHWNVMSRKPLVTGKASPPSPTAFSSGAQNRASCTGLSPSTSPLGAWFLPRFPN